MSHDGKSRDDLARQANQVRTKLLHTVEELDQRRHEVVDIPAQLKRRARELVVLGAVVVVATAAGLALLVHRISTARQRRRRQRWTLAKDMWRHPERAMRGERPPFFGQMLRSVLLSVLTAAVTAPARRLVTEFVEAKGSPPPGAPARR